MLHPIVHDNKSKLWCGPAAIALITGQPTSIVTRMLLDDRRAGSRESASGVKGTTPGEVYRVLRELGMTAQRVAPVKEFLAFELVDNIAFDTCWPVLASTVDHWFVTHRGRYFDNRHPQGIKMPEHMRRQRVTEANAWRQVSAPKLPAPKPPKASAHPSMREARKLAAKFGIAIEYERDIELWYVHCPAEVDEVDDIFEGDHYAAGPDEVLSKVDKYVELVKHIRIHGELS